MNKQRRFLLSLSTVALLSLAIFSFAHAGNASAKSSADVFAVKFHADWCGSCKAIQPNLDKLAAGASKDPVLFLTLDLTDEKTTQQAAFLASALGIGAVMDKYGPKTGFVLLVDSDNKQVLAKLDKKQDLSTMNKHLRDAVRRAK